MTRPAKLKPEVAKAVGQKMDQAILELTLKPQSPHNSLQEFLHEFADGYSTLMTYNPDTGVSKLRDHPEVLTVPYQRRREYAAWLREVADRLEVIQKGQLLEEGVVND
jgi:hypothetical protein